MDISRTSVVALAHVAPASSRWCGPGRSRRRGTLRHRPCGGLRARMSGAPDRRRDAGVGWQAPTGVKRVAAMADASEHARAVAPFVRLSAVLSVGALLLGTWNLTNHRPSSWGAVAAAATATPTVGRRLPHAAIDHDAAEPPRRTRAAPRQAHANIGKARTNADPVQVAPTPTPAPKPTCTSTPSKPC